MKFQVFIHFGRVSGTPGAVTAGPAGVVVETAPDSAGEVGTPADSVGLAVHLVQTVDVTVDETVMVETVVPTSMLVVPAVV
jgi:hypothetical protein